LTAGDSGESSAVLSRETEENDDPEGTEPDSPESLPLSEENTDTGLLLGVQLDTSTGKIVNTENLAGVRVGSAGGWSLEVFPGDFVVHRKYGIGRFERTMLRSKTRLPADEKKAQDDRRNSIEGAEKTLRREKG
jgi:hypothetical protein